MGIAPLAILQDQLDGATTVLLGFRGSSHAEGASLLDDARLATDDGSVGHRGLVTDLLAAELGRDPHATVYACGPPAMLEATRSLCAGTRGFRATGFGGGHGVWLRRVLWMCRARP